MDDQLCDECQGARCGGKFAPFFCANVTCLQVSHILRHIWCHILSHLVSHSVTFASYNVTFYVTFCVILCHIGCWTCSKSFSNYFGIVNPTIILTTKFCGSTLFYNSKIANVKKQCFGTGMQFEFYAMYIFLKPTHALSLYLSQTHTQTLSCANKNLRLI